MVGVAFLHSQDTQCLYALVEVEQKKTKFELQKSDKNLSEDHSQTSCTSSDLQENTCNVSKRSG